LYLWLGKYPEHTANFLRLTLLCVLLDTLINPLYTANLATGKVAIYNKRLSILSLSFIPITYLGIKYTGIAEIVFILNVIRNMFGIVVRMFIMRSQLTISIREYVYKVASKVILVSFVALIIPLFVYFRIGAESFLTFVSISMTSAISILLTVYFVGLENKEKKFLSQKVQLLIVNKLHR